MLKSQILLIVPTIFILLIGCKRSNDLPLPENAISVDAANSQIQGTSGVLADGSATSVVTITLNDALNVAVVGIIPTFAATDTDSTNNYGTCSASDSNGVSTCSFTSTKAEIKSLSITSPVMKVDGSVTFIAGASDSTQSTITGVGPAVADGADTSVITITLKDASGNAVAGQTPTFSATDWEGTNNYGACSVTDGNGLSTCTLTSSEGETKVLSIVTPFAKTGGSVVFTEIDNCTGNTANAPFALGDGSVGSPFGICTAAQLNNIGANAAYLDKHFKLYANLDLASYTANSFTLIGTLAAPFMGIFNGNRKVIANLTYSNVTAAGDYLGLFRKIGTTAVVKNLGLTGMNITGRSFVGALAGENVGIVDNCYAKGTVSGSDRVGGLLGRFWEVPATTYVLNSYAEVNVTGTGFVGGLIGWVRGTVTGSHAIGNVTSAGDRVGGLVGTVDQGTINTSYAQGNVTGRDLTGGLIGTIGGSISSSHALGSLTCRDWCGGLVGNVGSGAGSGLIRYSYTNNVINGRNYVGGIAGYAYATYPVQNSYSLSPITANTYIGGIVGVNYAQLSNNYFASTITGVSSIGGLGGYSSTTHLTSFWDDQVGGSIANSTGASTTAVMQTAQTYITAGWSSAIWNIQDGAYPTLK